MKIYMNRVLSSVAMVALLFSLVAPAMAVAQQPQDPFIKIETLNGAAYNNQCVSEITSISGSGLTGNQGNTFALEIGWGDGSASTTISGLEGKNTPFTFNEPHTPNGPSTGVTLFLYHVQDSGKDGVYEFAEQCTPTTGTLTVIKEVIGSDAPADDFSFQVNGGSEIAFEADGQNDLSLESDTYTVTEVVVDNYDVSYEGCENINLSAGGEAICTITNTYNPAPTKGTLTIKKDVIDSDDSDIADSYSFSVTVNGVTKSFSEVLDADFELVAGEYLVIEGLEVNYTTVSGVGSTTVAVGENTTVTIVNKKNAVVVPTGTITIEKTAVNGNDTFAFSIMKGESVVATTSITTIAGNGSDDVVLEEGTYSISEENLEGWTEGVFTCTTGEIEVDASAIVLTDGMEVICTVTNTANIVEPPVCDAEAAQTIVSDTLTFEGGDATVPVSPINAAWTAAISGATWIWGENPISDSIATTSQTFTRTFDIIGTPTGATLSIAADNTYSVSINGSVVGSDLTETNYKLSGQDSYVIPAELLVSGVNTITITVTNIGLPGSTPLNNPAGLLYKLVVTNNECEVPPLPVCSDKVDNDNDGLTDAADPACHIDGDVNNPESYDEKIDSEANESAACSDGLDNDGDQLIDSLDPNCLTDGEWDPQDDDESSPTTPPADVCSNIDGVQETVPSGYTANDGVCEEQRSSGGGGSRRSSGSVLGASTGEVLGASCGLYMDRYLKLGAPTNDEVQVIKLQAFLNTEGLFNRVPTGVFDMRTHNAVKDFQEKYFADILTPWGLTGPTGLVYLTTLHKINMIECPDLMLKVPALTPWTGSTNTKFAQ